MWTTIKTIYGAIRLLHRLGGLEQSVKAVQADLVKLEDRVNKARLEL